MLLIHRHLGGANCNALFALICNGKSGGWRQNGTLSILKDSDGSEKESARY